MKGAELQKSALQQKSMSSLELTSLITALANAVAAAYTQEELALVACIFVQLGDTLATIASQRALCEEQ